MPWGSDQPSLPHHADRGDRGDRGDIVLGWLTKVVIALTLVGIIAYDGLSIVATRFSLADDGQNAAIAASTTWKQTKDVQKALAAAQASASSSDILDTVIPSSLVIDPDGTVHLRLQREATTVVLNYIGPLKHWSMVTVTAEGRDVGS